VPDRVTALAINSEQGRSQNQLHIHISCVRPDVVEALERARRLGRNPSQPMQLRLRPENHSYRAVVVRQLLGNDSPFSIVAKMPGAAKTMGRQSIAVIGSRVPQNYYVLDTVAGPGNPGSAEELLDQTCSRAPRE
jgi:CDP-diacylglycerol pyrophosphatase